MNREQLTEQEIHSLVEKAQAYYRKTIRPQVYPEHKGRMLVIDLDTLDYEIADRDSDATHRLWKRHPGCLTLGIRVGYKAAYHFSARRTLEEEC